MKLFVVRYADYEDEDIYGIASTMELAQNFKDTHDFGAEFRQKTYCYIQEFELDKFEKDLYKEEQK